MSQYVTVEQIKDALGIKASASDTVDDATLLTVSFRASAMVDSHLSAVRPGYVGFAAGSNARAAVGSNTRTYHGTGTDTVFIDDAASVASVTVDSATITSTAYVAEPLNQTPKRYLTYIRPSTYTAGLYPSVWSLGTANVAVTGFWATALTIPDDVAACTLALSVLIWQRQQDGQPPPDFGDPQVAAILGDLDQGWAIRALWGA